MALIQGVRAFRGVLLRLRATNDAIVFYNRDETLKIMLRNDPEVGDPEIETGIEVCLVVDDDALRRALRLEHAGYFEDEDLFVLDALRFDEEELRDDSAALRSAIAFVNTVHLFTLCPCGRLVKDDAKMCMLCHLTSTDADLASDFCFVCRDTGPARLFVSLPCCDQRVHRKCLDTWREVSGTDACPHCRATPDGQEANRNSRSSLETS